jgi:uncharacterized protein (DUF58 family)
MPREVIHEQRGPQDPPEVFVTLRDLIGLQYESHGFSFLPRYAIQSLLSGRHRSRLRGRGLDFDEVRKYVAGDDIRNIDWRVTARVGSTHTKVFTEERERPVMLVVDQSTSMFFGSRRYMKSVVAAHLAALGAWRTLEVGDRVGGIVFGDRELQFVPPKRDRRTVQRLLSLLAEMNRALGPDLPLPEGDNMLNRAMGHAEQLTNHDFLVVVISDFRTMNDEVMKKIIRISRHNDLIAAQVSDPLESQLPPARWVVSDGTHQATLEETGPYTMDHQLRNDGKSLHLASQMKRYGIPLIPFHTGESAAVQLRKSVGGMARTRRKK